MNVVADLHQQHGVPITEACEAFAVPRGSFYRGLGSGDREPVENNERSAPPRALGDDERLAIIQVLSNERFQDQAPRQVYATLLDEGCYLSHWRTMYRVLESQQQVRERRQAVRDPLPAPQLQATAPCQVWTWDITKLRGPKGVVFHLYVILDIFSRYVVGWTMARKECKHLAAEFIEATCEKQNIEPGQLTLHADRGASMRSSSVSELLDRLGVERSHSRPRVSDDNPFSEAQFKTLKYVPDFPDRFISEQHAWQFLVDFFDWYNEQHRHSGIALLTPSSVHWGRSDQVLVGRDAVLEAAFAAHPERFVNGPPRAPRPPTVVAINPLAEHHATIDAGAAQAPAGQASESPLGAQRPPDPETSATVGRPSSSIRESQETKHPGRDSPVTDTGGSLEPATQAH